MTDHYTTLGVARTASADEIKQAYRRLASKHHPDRGGDTKTFQQIQSAYDVLSDQEKRAAYDNPNSGLNFNNAAGQPHFNFNFAGDLNDFFRQSFGHGFSQRRPQSFVRLSLWIRLTDVITGGRRPVAVNTGQGSNTIEIEIPKGINDGDSVQYSGLAPGGGDLVVQFRIHPDPRWHRENLNLITEHDISIWNIILGGDLVIKTLPGDQITVKVPPRCQPKNLLRIRGKGIPDQQGQVGDLFVRMIPVIPDNIDPDLLHAIERYKS